MSFGFPFPLLLSYAAALFKPAPRVFCIVIFGFVVHLLSFTMGFLEVSLGNVEFLSLLLLWSRVGQATGLYQIHHLLR